MFGPVTKYMKFNVTNAFSTLTYNGSYVWRSQNNVLEPASESIRLVDCLYRDVPTMLSSFERYGVAQLCSSRWNNQ